ncbi:MAG: hypothetical protein ACLFM6_06650 [Spirochaetaceae bacterium]
MSDYRRQMSELERSISEHEARLGSLHATIGRYVRTHREDLIEQKRLRTKAREAKAKQKEHDETADTIARLEQLQNRREELQEQIADARAEVERLTEELDPLCREIGEVALRTYRQNPVVDPKIEEIFSPLIQQHEELKELERQINEQEYGRSDQSKVARLMSRGRLAFLKGKKSARENALPRMYREAGKTVCQTTFISRMEDSDLSATAKPYFQKHAEIEELERNISSLEDERKSTADRLSELTQSTGGDRRLRKAQEAAAEELRSLDREIGEKAAPALDEESELPQEIGQALEEAATYQSELKKKRDRLRRLKAAVELEEASASVDKLEERISTAEAELVEKQKRLEELQKELENARAEARRLEKARGPEEELEG